MAQATPLIKVTFSPYANKWDVKIVPDGRLFKNVVFKQPLFYMCKFHLFHLAINFSKKVDKLLAKIVETFENIDSSCLDRCSAVLILYRHIKHGDYRSCGE